MIGGREERKRKKEEGENVGCDDRRRRGMVAVYLKMKISKLPI